MISALGLQTLTLGPSIQVASTKLTGIYARLRVVDSLIRKIAISLCSLPSMKGSADEITSVLKAKFPSESKAGLKERILQTLGAHASFNLIEPGLTEWELLEPWREHALVGLESLKNDPEVSQPVPAILIRANVLLRYRLVCGASASGPRVSRT